MNAGQGFCWSRRSRTSRSSPQAGANLRVETDAWMNGLGSSIRLEDINSVMDAWICTALGFYLLPRCSQPIFSNVPDSGELNGNLFGLLGEQGDWVLPFGGNVSVRS